MSEGVRVHQEGISRVVVCVGRYAFKLPRCRYGWRYFLHGLLANMGERHFAGAAWPELCPVVWGVPGGWLLVMRRARPLTDDEWDAFDVKGFTEQADYLVPVEPKRDSFGVFAGRIVAVDYGH